jgi:TPP-dependent pyruvate/acetoin dehydrogenase alpha subunit
MADKQLRLGAVTACFFGEGAVDEGAFHESLNLAALWRLPVLFVCENNLYAMGMALQRAAAETDVTKRAAAYRMRAEAVDGMDVVAVEAAARRAVEQMRAGGGPALLECRTYRFRAHSMFDAQLYRSKEEIEAWREREPILRLARWMAENGLLHSGERERLEAEIDDEIEAAVAFAEAGTLEPVEDLTRFVTMSEVPQERIGAGGSP